MTENPNTPPDPNAGQPPGPASGQPVPPPPASQAPQTPPTPQTPQTPPPAQPVPVPPDQPDQPGQPDAAGGGAWVVADDEADYGEPLDPNAPNTGVAATFLPGIEAASVIALLLSMLAAGAYLLVYPLVQAHSASRTWSDFKNNVPRARQDPFGTERDWIQYQSWAHIILGLLAVLLALLVLGLWTAQRNRLYSRAFAQAALVLGLAVVLYGILLKTGVVGSEIPSMKDISGTLSSQQ